MDLEVSISLQKWMGHVQSMSTFEWKISVEEQNKPHS